MARFSWTEILSIIVIILGAAAWITAVIDCLRHESNRNNKKLIWLLVITLGGCLGAAVYLVFRMPQRKNKQGK